MTPAAAIWKARLEAVQRILVFGECGRTVTDIAYQYSFTNPGRFAGLYKRMFGVSPSNDLRRNPFRRPG